MKSNRVLVSISTMFLISLMFVMVSCDNTQKELQAEVDEFGTWVENKAQNFEEASDESWEEMEESWNEVEAEYNEMIGEMDKKSSEMKQETREQYREVKDEYMALKQEIKAEIKSRKAITKLEDSLMISGADDELDEVTADNILGIYQSFVDVVDKYKDDYTAQQWNLVDTYWNKLNNRKNEVEKNIPGNENAKIAQLKIEYAGYKTVYKTGAKMEDK